jgi:hypothetical protein
VSTSKAPVQESLRVPWGGLGPARSVEAVFRAYSDLDEVEIGVSWRHGRRSIGSIGDVGDALPQWRLGQRVEIIATHGGCHGHVDRFSCTRFHSECNLEGDAEDRVLGRKAQVRTAIAASTRARRLVWRAVLVVAALASIYSAFLR